MLTSLFTWVICLTLASLIVFFSWETSNSRNSPSAVKEYIALHIRFMATELSFSLSWGWFTNIMDFSAPTKSSQVLGTKKLNHFVPFCLAFIAASLYSSMMDWFPFEVSAFSGSSSWNTCMVPVSLELSKKALFVLKLSEYYVAFLIPRLNVYIFSPWGTLNTRIICPCVELVATIFPM